MNLLINWSSILSRLLKNKKVSYENILNWRLKDSEMRIPGICVYGISPGLMVSITNYEGQIEVESNLNIRR